MVMSFVSMRNPIIGLSYFASAVFVAHFPQECGLYVPTYTTVTCVTTSMMQQLHYLWRFESFYFERYLL